MKLDVAAAVVDGRLVPGRVEIVDGLIAGFGLSGAGRGIAAPGFVERSLGLVLGDAGGQLHHTPRAGRELLVRASNEKLAARARTSTIRSP